MLTLPVALPNQQHPRGLYIAPWMGTNGEIVLLALTADHRLAAPPLEIPFGADGLALAEQLELVLDAADPPRLQLISSGASSRTQKPPRGASRRGPARPSA